MARHVWVGSGKGDPASAPQSAGDYYLNTTQNAWWKAGRNGAGGLQWRRVFDFTQDNGSWLVAVGPELVFNIPGAGGVGPDDVELLGPTSANGDVPFGFTVTAASAIVNVAGGVGSSVQLRTASGGGGAPASGPISTVATGKNLEGPGGGYINTAGFVPGSALFLRRSDQTASLELRVRVQLQAP